MSRAMRLLLPGTARVFHAASFLLGPARVAASGRRAAGLLLGLVTLGALPAAAQESPPPSPPPSVPAETPAPRDTPRPTSSLSEEDREVVANLELLESLETTEDLELLLELGQDE